MKIRLYELQDLSQIQEWCKARGLPLIQAQDLSASGYIADGIAVGFVYLTNSRFAILDAYLSNPKASKAQRDQALDAITLALIEHAKCLGYTRVKCDTKLKVIQDRARKLGFQETGEYSSFLKEI